MIIGAGIVEIRIHGSRSLKQKRGIVRSIAQRVQNRFNISIAEVGGQGTWQLAELGLCVVGSDRVRVRGQIERALNFIEELHLAEVMTSDVEILELPLASLGDEAEGEVDWNDVDARAEIEE
jgi:uncharacterized protein YlxP (DUF503 family)